MPRAAEASDGRIAVVAPAGTEAIRLTVDGVRTPVRVIAHRDAGGGSRFELQTTQVDREGADLVVEAIGADGAVLDAADVAGVHLLGPRAFAGKAATSPAARGSTRAAQVMATVPSPTGISVACFGSGLLAQANENATTRAASTLKVAIVLAAMTRREGNLTSSSAFPVISSAIVASDNGAANQVLTLAGDGHQEAGTRAVNALASRLGMRATHLDGPYVQTAGRSRKTTSAADLRILAGALLETARDGSGTLGALGVSRHEARVLIGLMSSATYPGIVRAHTPGPVAHKAGWLDDQQNDLALVFGVDGGPCAVGIVTEGLSFTSADALGEQVVERVLPALRTRPRPRRADVATVATTRESVDQETRTTSSVAAAEDPRAGAGDDRHWTWIAAGALALATGLLVLRRIQVRRRQRRRRDARRALRP